MHSKVSLSRPYQHQIPKQKISKMQQITGFINNSPAPGFLFLHLGIIRVICIFQFCSLVYEAVIIMAYFSKNYLCLNITNNSK